MQTYDISLTISTDLPTWPGDPKITLDRFSRMEDGAACNVTAISSCLHIGTHVDAPYHFVGGKADTVEKLPLNLLLGRAYVVHLPDEVDRITADVLHTAGIPPRTRRLLLRTRNSHLWAAGNSTFQKDFVAFSPDGARYVTEHGIRVVGVDYLSVAPFDDPTPVHRILLEAGVLIIEGLDLSRIDTGRYTLYCLPLKVAGADGAPARAILVGP